MSTAASRGEARGEAQAMASHWGLAYLVTGVAWIFFAFLILSFDLTTVWGVAVFAAVGLISGGVLELAFSRVAPSWGWAHALLGVASIVAGIVALVWPGTTFLVLAGIIGWYLMVNGVVDIVIGFTARDVDDLWWLTVVIGVAEVLVGFWAVGYTERSVVLLVVWVAAAALGRGLSSLFLGFGLHRVSHDLRSVGRAPA